MKIDKIKIMKCEKKMKKGHWGIAKARFIEELCQSNYTNLIVKSFLVRGVSV